MRHSTLANLVPDWLRRALALHSTVVPWHDVVRSGLSLPGPMALGLLVHDVPAALFGSLGALLAVLAERSGTSGQRVARIGVAAAGGVVAMVLGRYTAGTGVTPLLVVCAFALVAGVLSSVHLMLSFAGMQLLVQMSIAGGLRLDVPLPKLVVWYVGGVIWVLLGVAVQGAIEHTGRQYRRAVARIPTMLAAEVLAGHRTFEATETAMADAFALLSAARPVRRSVRLEARRALGALSALPELVTRVTAEARTGDRTTRERLEGELGRLTVRIQDGTRDAPITPSRTLARTLVRNLPQTLTDAATRSYVARVVLCMGLAEVARQADPVARGYWILLTVALTLKPDFQPVLARTLQRAAGTLLGAMIAVLVLQIPVGVGLLPVLAVAACGIPYAVRRSYGLFTVLITPIVLVLLDFVVPTSDATAGQRIVDTLIGCGIVVVFGYLLWPGTWRRPARAQMAATVEALASWLSAPTEWDPARAELYQRVAALRTVAGHGPFEPTPVRRRREAWSCVLDRIVETAAAGAARRADGREERATAARDLRGLAAELRGRPSGPRAVPTGGGELDAAVIALVTATRRIWQLPPTGSSGRHAHPDSAANKTD